MKEGGLVYGGPMALDSGLSALDYKEGLVLPFDNLSGWFYKVFEDIKGAFK